MKSLSAVLWAEFMKVRRSTVFAATIVVAIFIPLVLGFLMLVIQHPELASKARMLAIKATMLGKDTWASNFDNLIMVVTMGGLILFGFAASWIFGREYSDRTVKDLLALPVPRGQVVFAKFVVFAVWSFFLMLVIFFVSLAVGFFLKLKGWVPSLAVHTLLVCIGCGCLTILSCTPIAFFASFGKGYLAPMAFVIIILMAIQVSNFAGYTAYIPWAIPMLLSGSPGPGGPLVGVAGFIVFAFTTVAGYVATLFWWRYADQV